MAQGTDGAGTDKPTRGGARGRAPEQHPGLRATHGSRAAAPERGIDASRRTGREPNAPPVQGSRWLSSHPVGGPGGGGCDHSRLHLPHREETLWLHMLAVAALTVLVTHILYTDSVLEYPFNDAARVGPDAFELVLRQIEGNSN